MTSSESMTILQKLIAIFFTPKKFFGNINLKNEKSYDALKFFLIFGILPGIFAGMRDTTLSAALFTAALGIMVGLLNSVVISALACAFGRLAFKTDLGYWRVLRVLLYVYAVTFFVGLISMTVKQLNPLLYAEMNFIFTLVRLYLVYVLIIGISVTAQISMLKAFASIFVPNLVFALVVGSALYTLGVFSPPKTILVDKSAAGFFSFQVNDWTLSAGDGTLELVIKNKYGEPVTITSVKATRVGSVATCNSAALGSPLAEDSVIILITNAGSCAAGLASGEPYTLNVAVSFTSPTGVSHTEVGTLHCGNFPTCETRAK